MILSVLRQPFIGFGRRLCPHEHRICSDAVKSFFDTVFKPCTCSKQDHQDENSPKNTKPRQHRTENIGRQRFDNFVPFVSVKHNYSSLSATIGLILAALYAGKNPAKAPAMTNKTNVVVATPKSTCGFRKYSLLIIGPANSSNNKLIKNPIKPAMVVIKIDSCKIILTMENGEAPSAFLIPISLVRSLTIISMMLLTPTTPAMIVQMPTHQKNNRMYKLRS